MKKIYTKAVILFLLAFSINVSAQCSGCTISVTGLDTSPHIVSSGQVFCIAPTGTVTGDITVMAGGTLCNQGTMNSFNLWISGGTLKNYGMLNTNNVLVESAGTYTNNGTSIIDSLFIRYASSSYINNGTQTSDAFAIAEYATVVNTGTINALLVADSLATITNNGSISITGDGFSNAYSSTFVNNGNLTINNDFANSTSSNFTNNNYMNVMRDFYNATNANFTTKCMVSVGRDWYNSSNVYGPTTGCGGFNITGISFSSGVIGSLSTHIDICDAGNPFSGIDGNSGSIANTTTYCSCVNSCVVITGIKELVKETSVIINSIFPNPSSSNITVKLNHTQTESLLIEVRDMMGKTQISKNYSAVIGENNTDINVSLLAQGTYILTITDSKQLQTKRLFTVVK